jgi:outer membrane protein assembly factor BamB/Flp pilus assembly protein TadD
MKWKTSINAPAWFAPIIGGNVIYVTNTQGAVYALDKVNGAIRWRSPTTPSLPSGPPVLAGNQVIVSAAGGTLFSLNATTGQRSWTKTYGAVLSSPWAADNALYFTARDGNLYACDLRTLDDKWKVEVGASNHTPIYDQGTLFVSSQKVRAVEAGTGRVTWEFNADAACSEPAVTAHLVCFGSSNGYVYALNKANGQEKWKFWTLAGGVAPQVTVADDTLYACTANGQIYALDLNSGALKWKFLTTGRLLSAPTIANGKLFAACEDRSIYAIDLAQATQLRAEGKTWWKELWSDEVAQAMIVTNADLRRRHLQRADELAEDHFALHFEIGWRACDAKDYDAARQQADTLKKLDPEHPDATWLLARIAKDQKRFADAEKHLREVARLSPRVLKVYVELDEVMEAQGKKFVPAEIMPPNAALAAALAETYNQKNQFEKAIVEYRRAIALDPQYSPPYNNLAWLYATCENKKLRNPKESLRLALKAVELSPRVAPILDTLAEAYYVNEQHDNAIDAISQAISLDRNNAHYRAQLAKFRKAKQAG